MPVQLQLVRVRGLIIDKIIDFSYFSLKLREISLIWGNKYA